MSKALKQACLNHASGDLRSAESLYIEALKHDPRSVQAMANLGVLYLQLGRLDEAYARLRSALDMQPGNPYVRGYLAKYFEVVGEMGSAETLLSQLHAEFPKERSHLVNRAVVRISLSRFEDARADLAMVIKITPDDIQARYLIANTHLAENNFHAAIQIYRDIIVTSPSHVDSYLNLAVALERSGSITEARETILSAVAVNVTDSRLFNSLGTRQRADGQLNDAYNSFNKAVQLAPKNPDSWSNLSVSYWDMKRFDESIVAATRAIELNKNKPAYYYNRGNAFFASRRYAEAELDYLAALRIDPRNASAYNNLGNLYREQSLVEKALQAYSNAIEADGAKSRFFRNRGILLREHGSYDKALPDLLSAHTLDQNYPFLLGDLLHTMCQVCSWQHFGQLYGRLVHIDDRSQFTPPFPAISLIDDAGKLRVCTETFAREKFAHSGSTDLSQRKLLGRVRLGYYSTDFHNHATAHLMARFFELHDRSKFEVHAFSFGPVREDAMRRRLMNAFEHFHEVSHMSDREVAMLSRKLGIDIAFDLKGYTQNSRPGIFSERCAPVQVSFIGYPGTMGSPYIDYLIADKVVIPEESQKFYTEKILYMPRCYQVNDNQREVSSHVFTRKELGLPEDGFVFCSFNNNYKILPVMFDCWMSILKQVPGSVFWIFKDNDLVEENLRREAEARGVDAARLIFAARMPTPEHLARHRCADLFLDTFPCSAHTTASDALYMGLPLLTLVGETFASRVAASLLTSLGMTELIASSLKEYQDKALTLAKQPQLLHSIKAKLLEPQRRSDLMNPEAYVRDFSQVIESLY